MTPIEFMESPGTDVKQSYEMWDKLVSSSNPQVKGLASLWTAVCFLVVAERTKVLHQIRGGGIFSYVVYLVRKAMGWDKRLLWHFLANDAIRRATLAKRQHPGFVRIAESIVDRANQVLRITAEDAENSGQLRIVFVNEKDAGIDLLAGWMAIQTSSLPAAWIVECARSLPNCEVMFESVPIAGVVAIERTCEGVAKESRNQVSRTEEKTRERSTLLRTTEEERTQIAALAATLSPNEIRFTADWAFISGKCDRGESPSVGQIVLTTKGMFFIGFFGITEQDLKAFGPSKCDEYDTIRGSLGKLPLQDAILRAPDDVDFFAVRDIESVELTKMLGLFIKTRFGLVRFLNPGTLATSENAALKSHHDELDSWWKGVSQGPHGLDKSDSTTIWTRKKVVLYLDIRDPSESDLLAYVASTQDKDLSCDLLCRAIVDCLLPGKMWRLVRALERLRADCQPFRHRVVETQLRFVGRFLSEGIAAGLYGIFFFAVAAAIYGSTDRASLRGLLGLLCSAAVVVGLLCELQMIWSFVSGVSTYVRCRRYLKRVRGTGISSLPGLP